jgi:hypothetical protein
MPNEKYQVLKVVNKAKTQQKHETNAGYFTAVVLTCLSYDNTEVIATHRTTVIAHFALSVFL